MRNTSHAHRADHAAASAGPDDQAHRHAYNAAFDELGLAWQWDAATYDALKTQGRNGVRRYLEAEHPHLLRAYEAEFLVDAVEAAKARRYTGGRVASS